MVYKPAQKVDVPPEHWDRLYSPVTCAVMITTVDKEGRVNAASFATCVRQNHEPTCISFTVEIDKDTYHNVLATEEFVVNIPSFNRGSSPTYHRHASASVRKRYQHGELLARPCRH